MIADSNNTQGAQLFQTGRYNDAITSFQQALQRDPANADACYNLASTYHHLGMASRDTAMVTQAEALYNECLNREPNHVDAHRGLAVLLVQDGRKDAAFTLLRRWAAGAPLSPEPKIELARLYREFGDTQTATGCWPKPLSKTHKTFEPIARLARFARSKVNSLPRWIATIALGWPTARRAIWPLACPCCSSNW
ncbi:MAG: tetratricopeptide repeat protein [Pirellulaceae bacterium]